MKDVTPAPAGLAPDAPVAQYETGTHRNFTYLLVDWTSRTAALVDPHAELDRIARDLAAHGLAVEEILLTHSHWDHVLGVGEARSRWPAARCRVHPADRGRLRPAEHGAEWLALADGERIALGAGAIEVLHTPGHSPGECSFLWRGNLLTGDTLFIRDCGRTDLEGGSDEEMFRSLRRIAGLPGGTVVLPGHHYAPELASTIDRELAESPPLRARTAAELAALP